MRYSKGAEWKKWDLHIHSNASDGSSTIEEILSESQKKELSVIALTDHHTAKNIDEIRAKAKEIDVNIIAGIEFRTEYGEKSVHMIGLFPESYGGHILNSQALHDLILSPLGLSETHIKGKARERDSSVTDENSFKEGMFLAQVEFKKASDLVRKYGGLISVHAGGKSNSIEGMKHEGKGKKNVQHLYESLGTVKEDIMSNYVDICEINKEGDSEEFYLKKFNKPSLIASDAHKKEEIGEKFVWIKAEPTFEGLRQVLIEPSERVKIQEDKPDKKDEYNVIDKVKFLPKSGSKKFSTEWIQINENLNTIIGGKSSGKSLLLYFIAKTLGVKLEADFINYNKDELELDDFIVHFKDNMEIKMSEEESKRPIVYIPQLYLNELADRKKENLEELLLTNLLEKNGIKEEYDKFNNQNDEIEQEIQKNLIELFRKMELKNIEKKELEQFPEKQAIIEKLKNLQMQKEVLIKISKLTVQENTEYSELKEREINIKKNKMILENDKRHIDNIPFWIVEAVPSNEENYLCDYKSSLNISQKDVKEIFINKIKEHYIFIKKWEEELKKLGKEYSEKYRDDINKLNQNLNLILEEKKKYSEKIENFSKIEKIEKEIIEQEKIEKSIDGICKKIEDFDRNIEEIMGRIKKQLESRKNSYTNIIKSFNEAEEITSNLKIITNLEFEEEKFNENFNSILNMKQRLDQLFGKFFNNNIYQYKEQKHIENMLLTGSKINNNQEIKLKNNKNNKDVWLELTKNYYRINYTIEENGEDLHKMSPGKKGIILFKLFLEQKNPKYPILVDQPEDNLDNRTVYNELINFIKSKKKERQIIMVTHNANLVVSTDAEEVIVANQSGQNNTGENRAFKFEYRSGALENSFEDKMQVGILYQKGIKEHVCDILEGGEEAFKKREKSYRIKRLN